MSTKTPEEIQTTELRPRPLVIDRWVAAHMSDVAHLHAKGLLNEVEKVTKHLGKPGLSQTSPTKPASAHGRS